MTGESKMLQSSSKRAGKKIQRTASKVRGGNQDGRSGVLALQGQAVRRGWFSQEKGQLQKHPAAAQVPKGDS